MVQEYDMADNFDQDDGDGICNCPTCVRVTRIIEETLEREALWYTVEHRLLRSPTPPALTPTTGPLISMSVYPWWYRIYAQAFYDFWYGPLDVVMTDQSDQSD